MPAKNNIRLASSLAALAAGMVMLAYASVPLYRLFCAATGFGGTTQRASAAPASVVSRSITVRFNADTDPGLPWQFRPADAPMQVRVGQTQLTHYRARNLADHPVTGHAVYNVVPNKAGIYFVKLECFCFKNQTLQPGQEVNMPVSFFLDPALMDDRDMDDVQTITLSYTFFPATSNSK
ncbi:MAG: cytochrome c oxidase assembly protein [Alphaproteobacteria bacterium]|nr:cytochrome c oxidase assembly protein [Alphaproteobacteria bacterium]